MLFGMWVGSKGTGEESFTIRIPINISPWSRITVTPGENPLNIEGHSAAILEDFVEHGFYVLEVYDFPSEEAAYEILPSIQAGLVWAALRHGIALPSPRQTADVVYDELSISAEATFFQHFLDKGWNRLDGRYDWNQTVIKPEHQRLAVEGMGGGKLVPSIPDRDIIAKVAEAMRLTKPEKVFDSEQLRLALNTYSSSFFQYDVNARFLTLVTVLELLNPRRPVPQHVKDTINKLLDQVKEVRDACDEADLIRRDEKHEDYNSLLNRLGNLKTEAISQGIRSLVTETLQYDSEVSDLEEMALEARELYGLRSDLVHSRTIREEEGQAKLQRLMDIVTKVLAVKVVQATQDV